MTRIANTDADTFRKLANALEKAARGEGWRTAEAPRGASISFSGKREADCVGERPGRRSLVSLGKCRTHVCKEGVIGPSPEDPPPFPAIVLLVRSVM